MEVDEGSVAETNNSNCMEEGRRYPNPQGKLRGTYQISLLNVEGKIFFSVVAHLV